jgi:hypothetical protein
LFALDLAAGKALSIYAAIELASMAFQEVRCVNSDRQDIFI